MKQQAVQLIPSEYSPSGYEKLTPELGTRPELTQQEREEDRLADLISYSQALREYRLTADQFEALQSLAPSIFPPRLAFTTTGGIGRIGGKTEAKFSRTAFAAFFARMRELATWVPR
jgi:hypothetical protein